MDYDQATKTAEKLLRIGTLSYRQISYAARKIQRLKS